MVYVYDQQSGRDSEVRRVGNNTMEVMDGAALSFGVGMASRN